MAINIELRKEGHEAVWDVRLLRGRKKSRGALRADRPEQCRTQIPISPVGQYRNAVLYTLSIKMVGIYFDFLTFLNFIFDPNSPIKMTIGRGRSRCV